MKQKLLMRMVIVVCLLPLVSNAQLTVSGTVTDASTKETLQGVSVQVKGTQKGTVTGANGRYSLANVNENASLIFSYIGYVSQEVRSGPTVNVSLRQDLARLEEVVVTGLATTVRRSNLANAVATISAKELTGASVPQTLEGALNGKLQGANIVAASGAPGGGMSVRLRGLTSVNSNTQPLYVIDGVIVDNSSISGGLNVVTQASRGSSTTSNQDNPSNRLADINPEDIESVEVLKGPSAAAIYGALASSGVIIINTKRGIEGRTKISFSQDAGLAVANKLLGVRQWNEERIQQFFQSVTDGTVTNQPAVDNQKALFREAVAQGRIFDYEKEMYGKKGFLNASSLSLSGGTDRTKFFISGLYQDEDGIIEHTGYRKISVRANLDQRISNRFTASITTNYINSSTDRGLTNNDNKGVSYGVALSSTPTYADLFADNTGKYPRNPYAASNPVETRDLMTNNENVNRFIGGGSFTAFLQQNDFSITKLIIRGGVDYYTLATKAIFPSILQFQSDGNGTDGASIQGNTNNLNTNVSAYLVNTFGALNRRLNFTTSGGATMENFDQNQILNSASRLIGTQTNLNQASAVTVYQNRIPRKNRGLFLQEEVNFEDKIIITGGVRLDKSSDNADVNKYETFPKVSLALNVANFQFWRWKSVDLFKLRAAYGESGNFPPFGAKFTAFSNANIGGLGGTLIGVINSQGFVQRGNDQIKQERQKEFETGLDVGILGGKIAFEGTYYNRRGTDLIFTQNVPSSSGFVQKFINGGTLQNKGWEFALTISPYNTTNFKWTSRTSYWQNRSKMTRLDIPSFNVGAFSNALGSFKIEQGKPATQIVGLDGDRGVVQLGDAEPKFQMSFYNDLTIYKNVNLSFVLHWKQGGQNINLTELLTDLGGTSPDYDGDDNGNGISNAAERISSLGVSATPFVQNANYLRLRDVGLYYSFPANLIKNAFNSVVSNVRIGVSATNLFTITPYKSYDPEVSNFGASGFSTAVDVTPYPSARRMFFHLSVDF